MRLEDFKLGERFKIGNVTVEVLRVQKSRVKLGFDTPGGERIVREFAKETLQSATDKPRLTDIADPD